MLDYAQLIAPAADGGVLIQPQSPHLPFAAQENARILNRSEIPILGTPLAEWRMATRRRLRISPDHPVIVTGHQPAFIHPGVWAKNVVAARLAAALQTSAINLVVDQDAPQRLVWDIPVLAGGELNLRQVAFASFRSGHPYEDIPAQSREEIDSVEAAVRDALADRWDRSATPHYFAGLRSVRNPAGWVDQAMAGRREVDESYGFRLLDHRVSGIWWQPLLTELLLNARRFAATYNAALAEYRRVHKVRGANRPIADLLMDSDLVELPLWAYRPGGARQRVGISSAGDRLSLIVRGETIAELSRGDLANHLNGDLDFCGWLLRPRALTLTLWARLFLADLFIHGIGGAKYDRITDGIVRAYFAMKPPQIACVSATVRMDLPATRGPALRQVREELRDLQWNPQRHLVDGREIESLRNQRTAAVRRSVQLRDREPGNHKGRREAFQAIRALTRQLLETAPHAADRLSRAAEQAERAARQRRIAGGREYFFALYPRAKLRLLADTLPGERDFGV